MERGKLFSSFEKFLLFLHTFLFLSLFCVLSFNNRPAADDFYYLGNIAERGAWGCMTDLYSGYSGRWAAYLLTGWIVSMHEFPHYLLVFNCATLTFLGVVLYSNISKIISRKFNKQWSGNEALYFSILLLTGLFFSSYSIGETWFWLVQVCTYLWSIIMSLILLNAFFDEEFQRVQIPVIIISSTFIGGASESYALVNIFLLCVYLLFSNGKFKKHEQRNSKIILALIFLLLSFIVTMVAPGNEVRMDLLPKVSLAQTAWIQIKSFIKIIFLHIPLKLHYLFLFSFPWFVLGRNFSDSEYKQSFVSAATSLKKYFFLIAILIFSFLLPTSYIMSELGPDRALSQVSFLIAFSFAALFFYLGRKIEINERIFQGLKISTLVISTAVLFYHLTHQYSVTKKYARDYDKRIEILKSLKDGKEKSIIELEPLPSSGMLYPAEISKDTNDFRNQFLKKYSETEKSIRLK